MQQKKRKVKPIWDVWPIWCDSDLPMWQSEPEKLPPALKLHSCNPPLPSLCLVWRPAGWRFPSIPSAVMKSTVTLGSCALTPCHRQSPPPTGTMTLLCLRAAAPVSQVWGQNVQVTEDERAIQNILLPHNEVLLLSNIYSNCRAVKDGTDATISCMCFTAPPL